MKARRSSGVIEKPGVEPAVGQVLFEPRAHFFAERFGFGGVGEVHSHNVAHDADPSVLGHLCAFGAFGENGGLAISESCPLSRTLRQTIDETKASWARSKTIVTPPHVAARPPEPGKYRVAFLIYRGNPRCGGQGVYTRHLTRELVNLGHSVEVFSGPPWPELDEGVGFTAGARPRPLPRPGPVPDPGAQ